MTFLLRKKIKEAEKRILGIKELFADIEKVAPISFARISFALIRSIVYSYNTISLLNVILGELSEVRLEYAWDGKITFKLDAEKDYHHKYTSLMRDLGLAFDWLDRTPEKLFSENFYQWKEQEKLFNSQQFYAQYVTSNSCFPNIQITTTGSHYITAFPREYYYDSPTVRLTPFTYYDTVADPTDES